MDVNQDDNTNSQKMNNEVGYKPKSEEIKQKTSSDFELWDTRTIVEISTASPARRSLPAVPKNPSPIIPEEGDYDNLRHTDSISSQAEAVLEANEKFEGIKDNFDNHIYDFLNFNRNKSAESGNEKQNQDLVFKEFIEPEAETKIKIHLPQKNSSMSSEDSDSSTILDCSERFEIEPSSLRSSGRNNSINNYLSSSCVSASSEVAKCGDLKEVAKSSDEKDASGKLESGDTKIENVQVSHEDEGGSDQSEGKQRNATARHSSLFQTVYKLRKYLRISSRKSTRDPTTEGISLNEIEKVSSEENKQEHADTIKKKRGGKYKKSSKHQSKIKIQNNIIEETIVESKIYGKENESLNWIDNPVHNNDEAVIVIESSESKQTSAAAEQEKPDIDDDLDEIPDDSVMTEAHTAAHDIKRTESIVSTIVAPGVRVHVLSAKQPRKNTKPSDRKQVNGKQNVNEVEKIANIAGYNGEMKHKTQYKQSDIRDKNMLDKRNLMTKQSKENYPEEIGNLNVFSREQNHVKLNNYSEQNIEKVKIDKVIPHEEQHVNHDRKSSLDQVQKWLNDTTVVASNLNTMTTQSQSLQPILSINSKEGQFSNHTIRKIVSADDYNSQRRQISKKLQRELSQIKLEKSEKIPNEYIDRESRGSRKRRNSRSNSGSYILPNGLRVSGRSSMEKRQAIISKYKGRHLYYRPSNITGSRTKFIPYFSYQECQQLPGNSIHGRPSRTSTPQRDLAFINSCRARVSKVIPQKDPMETTPRGDRSVNKLDASLLQFVTEMIESLERGKLSGGESMLSTPHVANVGTPSRLVGGASCRQRDLFDGHQLCPSPGTLRKEELIAGEAVNGQRAEGSKVVQSQGRLTNGFILESGINFEHSKPAEGNCLLQKNTLSYNGDCKMCTDFTDIDPDLNSVKERFLASLAENKNRPRGPPVRHSGPDDLNSRFKVSDVMTQQVFNSASDHCVMCREHKLTQQQQQPNWDQHNGLTHSSNIEKSFQKLTNSDFQPSSAEDLLRMRILETSTNDKMETNKTRTTTTTPDGRLSRGSRRYFDSPISNGSGNTVHTGTESESDQQCKQKDSNHFQPNCVCRCKVSAENQEFISLKQKTKLKQENMVEEIVHQLAGNKTDKNKSLKDLVAEQCIEVKSLPITVSFYRDGLKIVCRCGNMMYNFTSNCDPAAIVEYVNGLLKTRDHEITDLCYSTLSHVIQIQWSMYPYMPKADDRRRWTPS